MKYSPKAELGIKKKSIVLISRRQCIFEACLSCTSVFLLTIHGFAIKAQFICQTVFLALLKTQTWSWIHVQCLTKLIKKINMKSLSTAQINTNQSSLYGIRSQFIAIIMPAVRKNHMPTPEITSILNQSHCCHICMWNTLIDLLCILKLNPYFFAGEYSLRNLLCEGTDWVERDVLL